MPYDTSQLVKDPNGLIKTGEYSSVNPNNLSDNGFQMATAYASSQGAKPLATITTESAASTLDKSLNKLNTYSPTTAPGYVPPTTTPTKETSQNTQNKNTVTIPKAYFTNEAGQEAEYTQDQLNKPETQKFLSDNGFAMTKTEGPTTQAAAVSAADKQINDLFEKFQSYNVDSDPSFAAEANGIRSQYAELKAEVAKKQEQFSRDFDTLAIREGVSRYNPERAIEIRSGIAMQATNALGSILRKEQSAISEARKAYASGKFTEFNTLMNHLEKIRDDKAATLKDINETLGKAIDEQRKQNIQSTRDAAVGGLIQQGITDPVKILSLLNYDESGQKIGDFTAKEIEATLKSLTAGGKDWQDKLSGSTRDFYILKGQGLLPGNITSLPENQQLFAYLKQEKVASTIGEKGNPLTLTEVLSLRKQGIAIPFSMVGKDQDSFNKTLSQENPPDWFLEKMQNDLGILTRTMTDVGKKQAWQEYQRTTINSLGTAEDKSNDYKKAKQYFSSTYDGLSENELDNIATQVETYVNGGNSYADAIAQTEKDLGK